MADFKNFTPNGNKTDLRSADAEKSFGTPVQNPITEAAGIKLGDSIGSNANGSKKASKVPIIVDLIAGILMLAIIVGIAMGAYYLFRYYADDYEGVDVEYTFICISENTGEINSRALRNKGLYLDTEDNALYFGEVKSAEIYSLGEDTEEEMLVVIVNVNVKYKDGEGYTVNNCRLAVGSDYVLRSESIELSGTVVEISKVNAKTKAVINEGGK